MADEILHRLPAHLSLNWNSRVLIFLGNKEARCHKQENVNEERCVGNRPSHAKFLEFYSIIVTSTKFIQTALGWNWNHPQTLRLPSESSLAFCRRKDYFFRIQNLNFLLFCAAANENFAEPQKYMQEHDTFSELLSFYLAREEDE